MDGVEYMINERKKVMKKGMERRREM